VAADTAELLRRCDELGAISEEPGKLTRGFASAALAEAGERVEAWMREAGLRTRIDAVGNVVGRRHAADPRLPTLLVGSHLDTVRGAGRYDGPLGVLAGIALAARLARTPVELPFALEIVGFADEEGLRYGTPYLGSRTIAGSFRPADLDRLDADGIAMRDAISVIGGRPDAIAREARPAGSLLGYVELHIEQGPVLESKDRQIGVVSAIAGRTRARLELVGEAGHAGTVPMALRRDPLVVAARVVQRVDEIAREHQGVVATVGELVVDPGAANVIPGRVTLSIDLRANDDATRLAAWEELAGELARLAREHRIELLALELEHSAAIECDPRLRALLRSAAAAHGVDAPLVTSGAGHDAVVLAEVAPVAMLFVRSPGGVSHHPDEAVRAEDVAVALDVLEEFVRMLAHAQSIG
jgi:allantoate deiminase